MSLRSTFLALLDATIYEGVAVITPAAHKSMLQSFVNGVHFKDELPFDFDSTTIADGDLDGSNEIEYNHNLDCDDPVFVVRWVDNEMVRGDEYFTITRISSNTHKFQFIDDIPVGDVTIHALKFV